MSRAFYIRLTPDELSQLGEWADEEHRSPQDQAVHLIVQALRLRRAEQDFAASLGRPDVNLVGGAT